MTKFLFSLSLILFSWMSLYAQRKPLDEVSLASPTAASLGKYADLPVNTHTGIPNITIPLYTIKEGSLELPIQLSYHASGVKVAELASWVGTGWSLNAGGMITRVIQGVPDESLTTAGLSNDHSHLSNKGFYNYLMIDHPASPFGRVADISGFEDSHKDGEPDMFFFNFGSYTGKFYFNDDGKAILIPEGDIKVDYTYAHSASSISSFVLTTPDGIKYHFGKTSATGDTDPVEIAHVYDEYGYNGSNNVINTWFLNRVESADGIDTITLTYTTESYRYFSLSSFPVAGVANRATEYKLIQNYVQGVRLSAIRFTNGTISFEPSAQPRQDLIAYNSTIIQESTNYDAKSLGTIRIQNVQNSFCKKYSFNYSYFEDNVTPLRGAISTRTFSSDRKRLKLESVAESSCDGTEIIPATTFEYFTETLPRRLSFAIDHWGFNNGATTNEQLIPSYTINEFNSVSGANRESAWPAMRAASLKRIIYPTGGYTEFDVEANTTWVSTTAYNNISRWQRSMGLDGSTAAVSTTMSFNGNPYIFHITNTTHPGMGYIRVKNTSTQATVYSLEVNPGESKNETIRLNGTFTVEIYKYKDAPTTLNGVDANVEERVPYANNRDEIVGGLRIKNIIYHDGISTQDRQVNYDYLVNGRSSGVLYSRPTYVQVVRNDLLAAYGIYNINPQPVTNCYSNGCVVCNNSVSFPYLLAPNSIRPMETSQGNHLGYNEVTVSETGNGFTVYRYYGSDRWDTNTGAVSVTNVNSNSCSITTPNFPSAPIPHEFNRGELKYVGHFNEAGRILKESNYYYTYEENASRTPAMITSSFVNSGVNISWGQSVGSIVPGTNTDQTTMFGLTTFYEVKTARKVYAKIEERLCSPDAACMTTTTEQFFESPYHHQLTRTLSTSSTNEPVETKNKYAIDFRVSNCDSYSQCYQDYNTSATSADAQLQIRLANVCGSNNQYCRFWEWQQHLDTKSSLRKTYLTCRDNLYTNVESCRLTAKTNADGELKPVVELQEQNNLAPIESSQWKNGKLLSATFNRFNYASSPNNQVYPSRIHLVNPTSLASTFSPANISSNTLIKDSRYQQETSL